MIAQQAGRPIVLMISREHCPYCELLKREVLQPRALHARYQNEIVLREVLIDQGLMLTNFQGRRQDAAEFSQAYGVRFTPTLLFLDPEGNELSERIVGVNTLELFNFYFESAIEEATNKILHRQ